MKINIESEKHNIGLASVLTRLPLTEGLIEFLVSATENFATGEIKLNTSLDELDLKSLSLEYSLAKMMEEKGIKKNASFSVNDIIAGLIFYGGPLFSLDPEESEDIANEITLQDLVDAINGEYEALIDKIEKWRNDYLNGMIKVMFDYQPTYWEGLFDED